MSDSLSTKELDALVLRAVKHGGGVDAEELAGMLAVKVYPNSRTRRLQAVKRSLQRLRQAGAVFYRPAWHYQDV